MSRSGRSGLDWLVAVPLAAFGGFALRLAAPAPGWWPMSFLGVLFIAAALWQQRAVFGALLGLIAGAAFWMPLISWLTLYLGPIPWLALAGVMSAWFALFGLSAALATRGIARLALPAWACAAVQAIAVAGLWVSREQIQGIWPYGGFAWGRLAHGQAEGPFAALASWLGLTGLSGLVALAGIAPVAVIAAALSRDRGRRRARRAVLAGLGAGGLVALALAPLIIVPPAPLASTGTLQVAAVQGDSKSGIFDDRENGDVFEAHMRATERLLDELEHSGESVDLIVWPENSAEFDLPGQPYRVLAMSRLAKRAGAPIVAGSILHDADGYTNSSVVVDDAGMTDLRYDKRRPVPFAEYMPNRSFFHALVPDLVDLVQLDYRAGTRPSVLGIPLSPDAADPAGRSIAAGIAICFDIIFDEHAVSMADDGAEVILAQTNNADFGRTDESAQQLQIARLRAVESGRALINISTVGTSAIVLPDGSDEASLTPFTADAMVADVPLVTGQTPALRFGAVIAGAWIAFGVLGLLAGCWGFSSDRSARSVRSAPAARAEE